MKEQKSDHIGTFIRKNVIPAKMSVTKAAEILLVGRPALSNLLLGKSALSIEMAKKFEKAFGYSSDKLLKQQAGHDVKNRFTNEFIATKLYTISLIQFKANHFEEWVKHNLSSRVQLPVLIRILVNSTGVNLMSSEFHGYDDGERRGPDGITNSIAGNQWIPAGKAIWEMGVSVDPADKLKGDFLKSIAQLSYEERMQSTFVFITPRSWPHKSEYAKQYNEQDQWKEVRIYDSSTLEQWMEQSNPAQVWFAEIQGMKSEGVHSLESCWEEWSSDCTPPLSSKFFDQQIEQSLNSIKEFLNSQNSSLTIKAESILEALAFLSCAFNHDELLKYKDSIIYFSDPNTLRKITSQHSVFIPVVANREVEKALAPLKQHIRSINIYPRNTMLEDSSIELDLLSFKEFETVLKSEGASHDEIDRAMDESGGSLTVLRRRRSKIEAIKKPEWSTNKEVARILIPFVLAGAWNCPNQIDQLILEELAHANSYKNLEVELLNLMNMDDSPVWKMDAFAGIVSKIDALFAIAPYITANDITNFFDVAKFVLSEDDPSLDLPPENRWAAVIYKKVREISSVLRKEIADTLILISVYGDQLLKERLSFDFQKTINQLIFEILAPFDERTVEAQSNDFPIYAEAAPNTFIGILEEDLNSQDSQLMKLMRPVGSNFFDRSPRTGTLWALEKLAWNPQYFNQVVLILAQLSQKEINDNWVNKPLASLESLFRFWMPQTNVLLEDRKAVFDLLIKMYPLIAWKICMMQINSHLSWATINPKFKWRRSSDESERITTNYEANEFVKYSIKKALSWMEHNSKTVADLIDALPSLSKEFQIDIWNLVKEWGSSASEEEKALICEKIKESILKLKIQLKNNKYRRDQLDIAKQVYEELQPTDLILKYKWLFKDQWVSGAIDDNDDLIDRHDKRENRIKEIRSSAINEIYQVDGIHGIIKLLNTGSIPFIVGSFLPAIIRDDDKLIAEFMFICKLENFEESDSLRGVLRGALFNLSDDKLPFIANNILQDLEASLTTSFLTQCPFTQVIWDILDQLDSKIQVNYWKNIYPSWSKNWKQEMNYAVEKLLEANRPKAAFAFINLDLEIILPRTLYNIMKDILTTSKEPLDSYQLDRYHIGKAFDALNESQEIGSDELAKLEFLYIDFIYNDHGKIKNLEKQIELFPDLFVQAIVSTYRRKDGLEDPDGLLLADPERRAQFAHATYKLLDRLSSIPGVTENDNVDLEKKKEILEKWIIYVRGRCIELSRESACDRAIGHLLSHAPIGIDNIWPCQPVRDILEKYMNKDIGSGIHTGLFNSRGVTSRSGGGEERKIANRYDQWAAAIVFTHPKVSMVLKSMVRTYNDQAEMEEKEIETNKRLRR